LAEQRGILQSWNDEKGFGFIQPDQGGARLFVHISAMRGDARPSQGQRVFFVPGQDAQGRLRAEHMRGEGLSLDLPSIRQKPPTANGSPPRSASAGNPARERHSAHPPRARNLPIKLLAFGALCFLPIAGSAQLLSAQGVPWPLAAYVLMSIVTFGLYWADKRSALEDRRRVPENRLHLAELLGGWPGGLVAQQVFRHKTRKASFQVVFWVIVFAHQALWADWLLADGRYLAHGIASLLH
jgi:uncharacterized membrane protein YsdA (DUF1294 family)/cold shock CspA family protein